MAYIHLAAVEVYGGYQTIFIATNIEDCQITYLIGRGENGA